MIDPVFSYAEPSAATRTYLDVRVSRFGAWYHFDLRHEDQQSWSSEISEYAERSVAAALAEIAFAYNANAMTDVPLLFVSTIWPDTPIARTDVVDMSDVYADVYESLGDVADTRMRYAVYATKSRTALAYLIETFGVFGMVFPLGVQANLWLQIGVNSWDFVLNDRAAESLPEHVLAAFADERLGLVPASPEPFIRRKAHPEKTVVDFARPRPIRLKR